MLAFVRIQLQYARQDHLGLRSLLAGPLDGSALDLSVVGSFAENSTRREFKKPKVPVELDGHFSPGHQLIAQRLNQMAEFLAHDLMR